MVHTARREHTPMECTRRGLGAAIPFKSDRAGELIVFPITRGSYNGSVSRESLVLAGPRPVGIGLA